MNPSSKELGFFYFAKGEPDRSAIFALEAPEQKAGGAAEALGDLLEGLEGRIDLSSFDEAYLTEVQP